MATTVKQKMKLNKQILEGHSVLFKPAENVKNPAVKRFYLMKHAFEGLGSPDEITLIIEATE